MKTELPRLVASFAEFEAVSYPSCGSVGTYETVKLAPSGVRCVLFHTAPAATATTDQAAQKSVDDDAPVLL